MITQGKSDELIKRIDEKDDRINELEDRVKVLENQNRLFERRLDDVESYGRRQNLRIVGIPPPTDGSKESADDVFDKAVDVIEGLGIPNLNANAVIDRAHPVGMKYKRDDTGEVIHPVIVRFTSWRARTTIYRKRERQAPVRFYTDLTKRRLEMKKLADSKTKNNDKVKFAFADINNSIGIRLADESMRFFNSEEELDRILQSL